MTYKQIPEVTFGSSPAAMYLARELNRLQDSVLLRNCGKRITATAKQVAELNYAYEYGFISPKTLANTLRLMRLEVTEEPDTDFTSRLRKNVQIGTIKRGIRLATVSRKAERIMNAPISRSSEIIDTGNSLDCYFTDSTSKKTLCAGRIFQIEVDNYDPIITVAKYNTEDVDMVTSELLHARSEKRCIRLNKPHTQRHIEP